MSFIEERLDEQWSYGSAISEMFSVDITETYTGDEYRKINHPYPKLSIDLDFNNKTESYVLQYLTDLFQRSGGRFGGFRFKHPSHFSTNGNTGTPLFNDQQCIELSTGVYQAVIWYGTEGDTSATRRRIRKPVAGSMLVGITDDQGNDVQVTAAGASPNAWTVDETTGVITFAPNVSYSITSISQAANAVIGIGPHTLIAGGSVHISGVNGMTEINGLRGTIQSVTGTTITVDIDSSGFSAYTSSPLSGTINTRPQANETVTCGCTFDIPVRFETDLSGMSYRFRNSSDVYMSVGIQLVELLNP